MNILSINVLFVSIIIPCRNEEKFIEQCLLSVIANDYPKDRLEILVIDGQSKDKTQDIIKNIVKQYSFIRIINNPQKITPIALNIGIKQARGNVIMRLDAHSTYKSNYISSCIKYLKKYNADNVGGIFATQSHRNTTLALSFATALSHPFGVGNSAFRTYPKKVQKADTVAYGCYRREVFNKIGLFNENLVRSQDMEFNIRLKKAGGRIILFPEIISYYYTSDNYSHFLKHSFCDGLWATYPLKFVKTPLSLRHYVPAVFVSGLMIGGLLIFLTPVIMPLYLIVIGLYLFLNFTASLQIAFKKRNPLYLFTMPLVFTTLHLSYGLGSIIGLCKILLPAQSHNMEHISINRKQQETIHYDHLAKQWQTIASDNKWATDAHGLKHGDYSSYAYLDKLLSKFSQNKKVLDYGCGTGIHSLTPLKYDAREVIGIDLSEESLKIARQRAEKEGLANKTQFIKMDCEKLELPDNNFDIILDAGTFSSLDLDKALSEIARVLKLNGKLIGIETLGHNPLTNLKRWLNRARGTRTKWATEHIFKVDDFKIAQKYFGQIKVKYFHLTVLLAMPFRKIPGITVIIKMLDRFDSLLLKIPFLKKYAFKIIFIFSKPKKSHNT